MGPRSAPGAFGGSIFAQDVPLPTGKRDGWRASVDLVWPIFDGGGREGRRRAYLVYSTQTKRFEPSLPSLRAFADETTNAVANGAASLRLLPYMHGTDGYFVASFRKR